ncbi:MAG: sigma-70 family RNA polymerase sigma factor, partial [Litorilinea sp.]
ESAPDSVDPAAASRFDTLDVQMQVRAGLDRLPPRQAELMILRHYRGYALDEIAQAWAISYGAAKAIHHRAMVGMRNALEGSDR